MNVTNQSPSAHRTSPVVICLATALVCLPILALAQFNAHVRVDEYDSWMYAYYGRQLLEGATLYGGIWDNKPPGTYWLNAIAQWLSGGSLAGIGVFCALAVAGTALVFFTATRRLYGWSAAAIATVLAVVYVNTWHYHVGCNRPATFLVLTELSCVAWYCRTLRRPGYTTLLLAGVCGGLGLWFKQSALAASVAVVIHILYLGVRREVPARGTIHRLAGFAAGWCIAVGAATVGLLVTADLRWAWDAIVVSNRMYFHSGAGASLMPSFAWLAPYLKVMALPLILAGATLAQAVLRGAFGGVANEVPRDPVGTRPAGLLVLLWVWMLAAVYLALVGPHERAPYLAVALAPLALLAAHGVYLLLRSGRRIAGDKPPYHVVVGVLWMGYMLISPVWMQMEMASRQYHHRFNAPPDQRMVYRLAAIQRYSTAEDALFVFGYAPELYWRSRRPPAIRYIGTIEAQHMGSRGQPLMDRITTLLIESEPKVILFHADAFAPCAERGGLDVDAFRVWLRTNYEQPEATTLPELWVRQVVTSDGPQGAARGLGRPFPHGRASV